jgi:hypothetical protein
MEACTYEGIRGHLALLDAEAAVIVNTNALASDESPWAPWLGHADVSAVGVAHARPLELVALRQALLGQSYLYWPLVVCTDRIHQNRFSHMISTVFPVGMSERFIR